MTALQRPIARSAPSPGALRPHRIAVLALDGVVAFDLAIPCTVFGGPPDGVQRTAPERIAPERIAPERIAPGTTLRPPPTSAYDVRICGLPAPTSRTRRGPNARARANARAQTCNGFALETPHGLRTLAWADTVIVPGLDDIDARVPPRVLAALRAAHARGARIVSICTGAFVLAAAGLLDGHRATTHWSAAAALAARFPTVDVDAAVLYVEDRGIFTSAGVAAGIDLCLHLLRQDQGSDAANRVARGMVVAPHRGGGQAQFAETPMPAVQAGGLERTRHWMLTHLGETLTVETLARHAAVSRRTFARRFVEETGMTPLQWLLAQRVLLARRLLESTDESMSRVAALAGFGDPQSLRQHFRRATGTTPLAFRHAFRGGASPANHKVHAART